MITGQLSKPLLSFRSEMNVELRGEDKADTSDNELNESLLTPAEPNDSEDTPSKLFGKSVEMFNLMDPMITGQLSKPLLSFRSEMNAELRGEDKAATSDNELNESLLTPAEPNDSEDTPCKLFGKPVIQNIRIISSLSIRRRPPTTLRMGYACLLTSPPVTRFKPQCIFLSVVVWARGNTVQLETGSSAANQHQPSQSHLAFPVGPQSLLAAQQLASAVAGVMPGGAPGLNQPILIPFNMAGQLGGQQGLVLTLPTANLANIQGLVAAAAAGGIMTLPLQNLQVVVGSTTVGISCGRGDARGSSRPQSANPHSVQHGWAAGRTAGASADTPHCQPGQHPRPGGSSSSWRHYDFTTTKPSRQLIIRGCMVPTVKGACTQRQYHIHVRYKNTFKVYLDLAVLFPGSLKKSLSGRFRKYELLWATSMYPEAWWHCLHLWLQSQNKCLICSSQAAEICLAHQWPRQLLYAFPPLVLLPLYLVKISPLLDQETLVFNPDAAHERPAMETAIAPQPAQSGTGDLMASRPIESAAQGAASERLHLSVLGFSNWVTDTLQNARALFTHSQYGYKWGVFQMWCLPRGFNPTTCPMAVILQFFLGPF
ncbi:UNVERIFIED_CONTAM: hypothetical protein FKN15_056072 [Acipenser sinensis]